MKPMKTLHSFEQKHRSITRIKETSTYGPVCQNRFSFNRLTGNKFVMRYT